MAYSEHTWCRCLLLQHLVSNGHRPAARQCHTTLIRPTVLDADSCEVDADVWQERDRCSRRQRGKVGRTSTRRLGRRGQRVSDVVQLHGGCVRDANDVWGWRPASRQGKFCELSVREARQERGKGRADLAQCRACAGFPSQGRWEGGLGGPYTQSWSLDLSE